MTQCIADIRKAIGDQEHRILRTVPRRGYMLVPSQRKADLPTNTSGPPVIAVIPFTSLVGTKGQALAQGVATEIINELARNRDLKVIGRDSSFVLGANQRLLKNWASASVRDIWLKARRSVSRTCLWSTCNSSTLATV